MAHDLLVLERDLRRCLPPRAIVAKRQELLSYDCDGLTLERHCPPLAVLPETTEQVAAVLQCCHQPVCRLWLVEAAPASRGERW